MKSIYSLIDLREILHCCNRRYLAHILARDDFSAGARRGPSRASTSSKRGDSALLHALQNPQGNIEGDAESVMG